jgi:hypothetical protein
LSQYIFVSRKTPYAENSFIYSYGYIKRDYFKIIMVLFQRDVEEVFFQSSDRRNMGSSSAFFDDQEMILSASEPNKNGKVW